VPAAYTPTKSWPLFIVVHGTYASGTGIFKMWKQYADKEGYLLLAPNFQGEYDRFPDGKLEPGTDRQLIKLIDELDEEYAIDRKRILLGGFSRGGAYTVHFVFKHPEMIHTAVVFNGAPNFSTPKLMKPTSTTFYLTAGSTEAEVVKIATQLAEFLKKKGVDVQLDIAEGYGHTTSPRAITETLRLFREMAAPSR
jgi:predicted esterase